jgi:hypothetical protein
MRDGQPRSAFHSAYSVRWSAILSPSEICRYTSIVEETIRQQRQYLSYLLRLWQASAGDPPRDPPLWRASLESPQTGSRLGFASLGDLLAFLEEETRSIPPGSQD